jgi:hypothetical protein
MGTWPLVNICKVVAVLKLPTSEENLAAFVNSKRIAAYGLPFSITLKSDPEWDERG